MSAQINLLKKTLDSTEIFMKGLHKTIKLYSYICIKTSSMYFQRTKDPKLWPVRWNKHSAIEQDWPCNCKLKLTVWITAIAQWIKPPQIETHHHPCLKHTTVPTCHWLAIDTETDHTHLPSISHLHWDHTHLLLIGHWQGNRPYPLATDHQRGDHQ